MICPDFAAVEAVARRGHSALAWEILRRNPDYVKSYRLLAALPSPGVAADPAFVACWGLHFRG
jgi:hypothetical protein